MWLCAECAKTEYNIPDEYDWRKVPIVWIKCDECGDDPCVMLFDHGPNKKEDV
jgi:hypothetical protein